MEVTLQPNEMVLKATDSMHYNASETISGKMVLTNQRAFFHPKNGQGTQAHISFHRGDLQDVMVFKRSLFGPKGVTVIKKSGETYHFSLKSRDSWVKALNKLC